MVEQSLRYGTVLASEQGHAAALIYPSGEVKDDRLWDSIRLVGMFKTALPRGLKVAEAMHARHPHPQPYSYLKYVGVAPHAQGQGWGGAAVRAVIAHAAEHGQGVLLETATPANVAIYSRLGFRIDSEWEVPGGGPKFWTMIHPAA
ncbi:GNAT family N-acetyltransferase [Erythrobacter sp. F6033]|uniref:GNAT family N-acetyltransferase n=1 Tax=Erythrobacter sp. F6033 TaxID=2926401 RepID=UPI001FF6336B|nr:GNAT family N-acetyltransferase [Erythrobacter sp. F6033]MCK0127503.1 GNAT family N-acetyltransferase [Erythrobacter sp. F6033]